MTFSLIFVAMHFYACFVCVASAESSKLETESCISSSLDKISCASSEDKQGDFLSSLNELKLQFEDFKDKYNSEIAALKGSLVDIKETGIRYSPVVLTACVTSYVNPPPPSDIIKFDNVRTYVGVTDVYLYKDSGKFISEKPGLYHVSVIVTSKTDRAQYSIYKNDNLLLLKVYVATHTGNSWEHTGTGVTAVELKMGDTISVKKDTNEMYVYGSHYSCVTIVKLY